MRRGVLPMLGLVLVGTALLVYLHRTAAVALSTDSSSFSEKHSIVAGKILNEFNRVCTEQHLPAMHPAIPPLRVDVASDEYGTDPGPTIKLSDSGSYQFIFLQVDGSLTKYVDNQLFESLYNAPYYDKPDKPKWTRDQAIQVGNSFLKVLSQQINMKLGQAGARFDQVNQNSKYHVGRWMIWWPRVDSKGRDFEDDRITMEIPEGHSPELIQVEHGTPYSEEKGEPLKVEQALEQARSKIASDKFWDKIDSIISGHLPEGWTDANPTGAYLQIVSPEHQKNAPARLAWVFWFRQHTSGHTHYPISFWIDAYTGKCIGGDVVGLDTPD